MAYTLWSQDIFTKGELSPFMYGRVTVNEYNNGLKTAQNVLTYPSGAAGKRFGTLYQSTLSRVTGNHGLYFQTFQYLNECVYQLVITAGFIQIFLEGILIFEVTNSFTPTQIDGMSNTVIGPIFRMTGAGFKPQDLTRSANVAATVTAFTTNTFTVVLTATPFYTGVIYPIKFTVAGGTMMVTSPQIAPGVTYFVVGVPLTVIGLPSIIGVLFTSSQAAKRFVLTGQFGENITISGLGTGTTSSFTQNAWTLANTTFKNRPVFDFNGDIVSYDTITFTPSATTGAAVTITLSAPYSLLDASYIGGAFIAAGGSSRITAVADTSHFTVAVQNPFDSTSPILGSLVFLAEPAWSDIRGWPQVCSSYQNRALFANSASLPNGFWASVINDYSDFGDLTTDDDDAISWYPTSDNMNYIHFIVPYRSITVHTNTGIYSSPLSDIAAITPTNFTLQLQDSTPADVLQPVAIDNQVLVLSGNDAHQMLWDGINNAYQSSVVSVINEQTIRTPQDETPYVDLHRAGSRFVFIVNASGSMAVFQTLLSQGVAGFTPQIMEQSYGNASFIQTASSSDGRAWFVVGRDIAQAQTPIALTGFTSTTLTAVASNFSTTIPTAVIFTTTGSLPTSNPQIVTPFYYWVMGMTADTFKVYSNQEDALANENAITFSNSGTTSNVVRWTLTTIFTLEELNQDIKLDCAVYYNGTPANTITTGALFNAQNVKMLGDGFGFDAEGINNKVAFVAHGVPTNVSEAYIGFPINTVMEPMPLNISSGPSAKETTLTQPKHIRWARFMFNNTIGGTINGIPIALEPFDMAHIGEPPFPGRGIFEMSIMKGWDDFNNPSFTIEHDEPFDIQLLGVFYSVEI